MSDGYLTTHVLDTAKGCPAKDLEITLYRLTDGGRAELAKMRTNADGRTDSPILPKGQVKTGVYELVFQAGAYLNASGAAKEEPRFLDEVPIRFGISDDGLHYHVPLLISPFGMSTYRGS